jgi:hypothetical protein
MISQDEALKYVNDLSLPAVKNGDILQHDGYGFIYEDGKWKEAL